MGARLCDKFDFIECPDVFSGNRSTGASVPGQGGAIATVPASIADVDKTGVEVIRYGPSYDINLVSGTGVVGSGFSTTNNEGTFFGNVPIESDQEFYVREIRSDKFKSQKYNGVLAFNIFGKKKRSFGASLGLVGKYNSKTSTPNGGIGVTVRGGPLSASFTRTREDGRDGNNIEYEYYTNAISAGFKIANLAVDWTYLKNTTPAKTYAKIFSASLFFKSVMFTWGRRTERHGHPEILFYDELSGSLLTDPQDMTSTSSFLGLQYLFKKRFIFGLYSNYYLNNDLSLAVSAFF